ncbi:PepSY-associated TM helix domain-containing protein [Campylobacter mucosalis]|uniref:PepSY-associated TM helix domain-containing protein n=1 Tax=Campylobacter mucosalis TaxID=202 RepID=UPI0024680A9C|nr:PepSY-associated TM helix domain-containing protein [Campylobacter mucosalis]
MNPTNGKITLEPTPHDEGFWGILLHVHEILLIENGGNFIVGIIGILSILVLFSGFIIYRNFYKNLFLLRRKNLAIFMSDIHKFIGVFSTPILLATAISGIWWEFRLLFMPNFDNSNFIIDNKIYNKSISLDDLIKRANDDLKGFNTHYISLPFFDGANIRLFGYVKTQNFLFNEYSSQIIYDKTNANLVQIQDISKQNLNEKFLETFRKAHFGNYNQFTKLLWFLAGLSPLILTISGIYLWIKRKNLKGEKIEKNHILSC